MVVGVDVGGTKIAGAVVARDSSPLRVRDPPHAGRRSRAARRRRRRSSTGLRAAVATSPLWRSASGLPSLIDAPTGRVRMSANVDLADIDVRRSSPSGWASRSPSTTTGTWPRWPSTASGAGRRARRHRHADRRDRRRRRRHRRRQGLSRRAAAPAPSWATWWCRRTARPASATAPTTGASRRWQRHGDRPGRRHAGQGGRAARAIEGDADGVRGPRPRRPLPRGRGLRAWRTSSTPMRFLIGGGVGAAGDLLLGPARRGVPGAGAAAQRGRRGRRRHARARAPGRSAPGCSPGSWSTGMPERHRGGWSSSRRRSATWTTCRPARPRRCATADVVACEDTRRTATLLRHAGSTVRMVPVHEHNEAARAEDLVRRMQDGETVALVSDAGMPAVSDPGARIVRAAIDAGIEVSVIPGPSAVEAALVASGLPGRAVCVRRVLSTQGGRAGGAVRAVRAVARERRRVREPAPAGVARSPTSPLPIPIVDGRGVSRADQDARGGRAGHGCRAGRSVLRGRPYGEVTVVIGPSRATPVDGTSSGATVRRAARGGTGAGRAADVAAALGARRPRNAAYREARGGGQARPTTSRRRRGRSPAGPRRRSGPGDRRIRRRPARAICSSTGATETVRPAMSRTGLAKSAEQRGSRHAGCRRVRGTSARR